MVHHRVDRFDRQAIVERFTHIDDEHREPRRGAPGRVLERADRGAGGEAAPALVPAARGARGAGSGSISAATSIETINIAVFTPNKNM